ncbi:MAG TPA: HPr(Ser) kinase/phosphatase [Clostridia bacterium]|nr:HPr(Ser) kinase/phosphatase [Clostridia bacterium]
MAESIRIRVETFAENLGMTVLVRGAGEAVFETDEIGRPGLQLAGYYHHFAHRRVQLLGNSEMHYLYGMSYEEAYARLDLFMSYGIPCVVCARNNMPPKALTDCADKYEVPVFLSEALTDDIGHRITNYLSRKLAPSVLIHGVMLDVSGVGILLRGASGLGKSETALEMIKLGHRLVADDVVELTRVTDNRLVGRAPDATRFLIEVRGIGIVDMRYLFGVGSVVEEKSVDLVMDLELWQPDREYDRLGGAERATQILGVRVPETVLPVSPGRNLAVVVEVAARNFLLKRMGYDTSGDFTRRARALLEGRE